MRKSDLTPARQRLSEICQEIGFGQIRNLKIAGKEPVLVPPPHIVRDVVFGKENGIRTEREKVDFFLKNHALEFFSYLDNVGDGVIELLIIKHGLPFQMQIPIRL